MIGAMIWKEFREQAVRLAVISGITALLAVYFYFDRMQTSLGSATVVTALFLVWFLPALMAGSTVASERSHRTESLLSALPIGAARVWTIKTVTALLTMLVPIAIAGFIISRAPAHEHETFSAYEVRGLLVGLTSLYLMTAALTIRATRETTVVMCGILFVLALFLYTASIDSYCNANSFYRPKSEWWFLSISPFGFALSTRDGNDVLIGVHVLIAIGWWLFGLFRYTRSAAATPRSVKPRRAAASSRTFAPGRCAISVLFWREFREQALILVGSALAGILIASVAALADLTSNPLITNKLQRVSEAFADATLAVAAVGPPVVALLLGLASWSADLQPRLQEFWRSRPISTESIFWSKFIVSIAGILGLLAGLTLMSYGIDVLTGIPNTRGRVFTDLLLNQVAVLPCILTFAILSAVAIRRIIFAGIVATLFTIIVAAMTMTFSDDPVPFRIEIHRVCLLLASVVFLLLARFAVVGSRGLRVAS